MHTIKQTQKAQGHIPRLCAWLGTPSYQVCPTSREMDNFSSHIGLHKQGGVEGGWGGVKNSKKKIIAPNPPKPCRKCVWCNKKILDFGTPPLPHQNKKKVVMPCSFAIVDSGRFLGTLMAKCMPNFSLVQPFFAPFHMGSKSLVPVLCA